MISKLLDPVHNEPLYQRAVSFCPRQQRTRWLFQVNCSSQKRVKAADVRHQLDKRI